MVVVGQATAPRPAVGKFDGSTRVAESPSQAHPGVQRDDECLVNRAGLGANGRALARQLRLSGPRVNWKKPGITELFGGECPPSDPRSSVEMTIGPRRALGGSRAARIHRGLLCANIEPVTPIGRPMTQGEWQRKKTKHLQPKGPALRVGVQLNKPAAIIVPHPSNAVRIDPAWVRFVARRPRARMNSELTGGQKKSPPPPWPPVTYSA